LVATLRLNSKWGVSFEYRLVFARGEAEDLGLYNAAGHGFAVGMTYQFPEVPDRPLSRHF
jgi:hypothetical protein